MAVMDYRTQDGLANYGFSIEYDAKSGWRVYKLCQLASSVLRTAGSSVTESNSVSALPGCEMT